MALPALADGRLGFSDSRRRMGTAIPAEEGGFSMAPAPGTPPTPPPPPPPAAPPPFRGKDMAPLIVADTNAASEGDIRWAPSGCNPPEVMDRGSGLSFNCGFSIICCCCCCCCWSCCCLSCCSCLARFK